MLRAYAARAAAPDLIALAAPMLDRLAALTGETVNLGVPTPTRRRPPRPARLVPLPGIDELGRAGRPVPRDVERQGVPRARRRRPAAGPARGARARHDHGSRGARARARHGPPHGRRRHRRRARAGARGARRPRPRRDGRDRRRALDLGPVACASRPHAATRSARCSSRRRRRCPHASVTATPHRELPDDPRGDPEGPLRGDPRRQQADRVRPDEPGPRRGPGAGVDALRRADPVARGGRRAVRARRLLRARDADRREGDAGRARHPAAAPRRRRRAADRHASSWAPSRATSTTSARTSSTSCSRAPASR